MTEREALIRAVCAEPWDDTRRLAFADWCDESGDPGRAYLIRHGSVPYRSPTGASCLVDFYAGATDGQRRTVELAPPVPDVDYVAVRGFVCGVICSWPAFWGNAKSLFWNHPITRVEITDKVPQQVWGRKTCRWTCVWPPEDDDLREEWLPAPMRHQFRRHLESKKERNWHRDRTGYGITYPDAESAIFALSDACVRYGRWLVGLPREYEPPTRGGEICVDA